MNEHPSIDKWLSDMKLSWIKDNYQSLLEEAVRKKTPHLEYLNELIRGEYEAKQSRGLIRRIKAAKFPVQKTLDNFNWQWPQKIDRALIEHLAQLHFVKTHNNVVFIGSVGVGKSHLATALGMQACKKGLKVLFCNTIEAVNDLIAAQKNGNLKEELKKYITPSLLILDELGYLPIDKMGANLLFQIISQRYERGSIIITTNKAFKDWTDIFNNDAATTSAVLDRIIHHCDSVPIESSSYRMKK